MTFLVGVLTTQFAFANIVADQRNVDVICKDARADLRDAGYSIAIESGGFIGMTLASLSETSLIGPVDLGVYPVKKIEKGTDLIYKGKGFRLVIALESIFQTDEHPAKLSAILENGETVKQDFICTLQ